MQVVSSYIQYVWNEGNLGFGGNVKKCLSSGKGLFTWVISDDDSISASEIRILVDFLEQINSSIAGIALPCVVESFTGGTPSLAIGLKPAFGQLHTFRELIVPTKLPFDYLAGFIIRTEVLSRVDFSNINANNDYIHSDLPPKFHLQ